MYDHFTALENQFTITKMKSDQSKNGKYGNLGFVHNNSTSILDLEKEPKREFWRRMPMFTHGQGKNWRNSRRYQCNIGESHKLVSLK